MHKRDLFHSRTNINIFTCIHREVIRKKKKVQKWAVKHEICADVFMMKIAKHFENNKKELFVLEFGISGEVNYGF